MRKVAVSDYTLKTVCGSSKLLFREKLALALGIERYGADSIELPAVGNVKEDSIIFKTISSSIKSAVVVVPGGDSEESIELAASCIGGAGNPRVQISLPVSTLQMEYRYGLKAPKMLELIARLVSCARSRCEDVEFEALDATRCDMGFLLEALETAISSGAGSVTVSDDAGELLPTDVPGFIGSIKDRIKAPLHIKTSDSIGMAVANAIVALRGGADGVKVSVSGKDSLKIQLLASALRAKGEENGLSSNLRYNELQSDVDSIIRALDSSRDDGKDMLDSCDVVFLDSSCTLAQVGEAVNGLGYDLSSEDMGKVHASVLRLCEKVTSVGRRDLEAVIATTALQVPETYRLVSYIGTTSNKVNCVCNVVLERDGQELCGSGVGGGPIDSAFKAIEMCVGHSYELDDFQIQALSQGKESLGSTLVKLRSDGRLYSGTGLSPDICGASIRAYLNALNKIVHEGKRG